MNTSRTKLSAVAALVGFLGSAGAAWACSQALWWNAVPEDQATGVPLNARISIFKISDPSFPLSLQRMKPDETFEDVAVTVVQRPGNGTLPNVELVPDAALEPNTRYRVLIAAGSDPAPVSTFTTGTDRDDTAPAAPTFEKGELVPYTPREAASGGECFTNTGFMRFTAGSNEAATFMLKEGGDIIAAGLPSQASLAFSCPASDRTIEGELYAVDTAGNVSPPTSVTLQQRCVRSSPLTGCSATSAAPLVTLAAALGFLRLFATRRRETWTSRAPR